MTHTAHKGRQWRHGIVYWAFIIAGLIDTEDGCDMAPTERDWDKTKKHKNTAAKKNSMQQPPTPPSSE